MTLLRRVRLYLLGPDKEMLEEPAPDPQPILTEAQRSRLRLELSMAQAQCRGDEVILLTRRVPEHA